MMVACAGACGKPAAQATPESAASTSAGANADAGPVTSAGADGGTSPESHVGVLSWQGSYTSVAAGIALPKDVRWRVPDSPAGLGDGTIALVVDSATGRVRGTVAGPLGPALLDGLATEGRLTATMAREDPTDHGFIGTLSAEIGDGGAQGTLNAAQADVSAVRTAAFRLSPGHGTGATP
jgi:hypothetical protein